MSNDSSLEPTGFVGNRWLHRRMVDVSNANSVGRMMQPAYVNVDDGSICCPVCGRERDADNTSVHIGPVTVRQNTSETTVDRETDTTRTVPKSSEMGAVVTVAMWCEAGHQFNLRLAFHKGATYLTATPGEPFDVTNETPAELWRD